MSLDRHAVQLTPHRHGDGGAAAPQPLVAVGVGIEVQLVLQAWLGLLQIVVQLVVGARVQELLDELDAVVDTLDSELLLVVVLPELGPVVSFEAL
jgi:hypothetical protein